MQSINNGLINYILPLLALSLLIAGILKSQRQLVISSLWTSLILLWFQYDRAGGEIFGSYFNYLHASIYSLTSLVFIIALLYIGNKLFSFKSAYTRIVAAMGYAFVMTSFMLLNINLWINAQFISERFPGTAILQVAILKPLNYCSYQYAFYKVNSDGNVHYLCPNHFGLIPSTGKLSIPPSVLMQQFIQNKPIQRTNHNNTGEAGTGL